jgi:hypothetical protein
MEPTEIIEALEPATMVAIGAAVLLLIVIAVLVTLMITNRRRARASDLEERFGAEYRRSVDDTGSRRRAEENLNRRTERREGYELRTLENDERERFRSRWLGVQAGFVDGPAFAVQAAHELIRVVAVTRGYPNEGLERCIDDISVDHPELVADLRSTRTDDGKRSTTEHHRQAFVHARALFERLVGEGEAPEVTVIRPEAVHAPSPSTLSVEIDEEAASEPRKKAASEQGVEAASQPPRDAEEEDRHLTSASGRDGRPG